MDAGLIDFGERGDGAFELAFEGAPVVDLLGEIAGAEVGLVEQFKADAAGARQSCAGEGETSFGQPGGGDRDGGTGFVEAVFDAGFANLLGYGGGVLGGESGVEGAEIVFVHPADEAERHGADDQRNHNQRGSLGDAERVPDSGQLFHRLHRHFHDFLVGRNELISDLLEKFERE
jgi:hypothetical protein